MATDELRLSTGKTLTIVEAEALLEQLGFPINSKKKVFLDLANCSAIEASAGGRLANALRRHAPERLVVLVPDVKSGTSQSFEMPTSFTRTGLGQAISNYAEKIETQSNRNITEFVKQQYEAIETKHVSKDIIYVQRLGYAAVNIDDRAVFTSAFKSWASGMGVISEVESEAFDVVRDFCFEAIQNVVDHANKKPLPEGEKILSYFSMRMHRKMETPAIGPFRSYRKRVDEKNSARKSQPSFLELIVSDDGVGMAARTALDLDIYSGPPSNEEQMVTKALNLGFSIKLQAQDSMVRGGVAGEGFKTIRDSIRKLDAFSSIRTGRLFATFDGLSPLETAFRFSKNSKGQVFGFMPGTIIQIVIPVYGERKEQRS